MGNQVCIVVGYGPGLGHGVATAFGKAGFQLGLIARTPSKQAAAVDALRRDGRSVEVAAGDAGDEASLKKAIDQVVAKLGAPSVLVYNAVAFRMAPPTALAADELVQDFRTNVAGALVAANAVLPAMKAKRAGAVLFTGGGWALYPSAPVSSTAIGKAGIRHLALMLNEELTGTGVRAGTVTVMGQIEPGTLFDPEKIGDAFLTMATGPAEAFRAEVQFTG